MNCLRSQCLADSGPRFARNRIAVRTERPGTRSELRLRHLCAAANENVANVGHVGGNV